MVDSLCFFFFLILQDYKVKVIQDVAIGHYGDINSIS